MRIFHSQSCSFLPDSKILLRISAFLGVFGCFVVVVQICVCAHYGVKMMKKEYSFIVVHFICSLIITHMSK